MLRTGIGWWRGTARGDGRVLASYLGGQLGSEPVARKGGTQWYRESVEVGDKGALVAFSPRSSRNDPEEVLVDVPQSALDGLGFDGSRQLVAGLQSLGLRPSRVDVYADDLSRSRDPGQVYSQVLNRDYCGSMRSHSDHGSIDRRGEGYTAYLGSRESDCFVRVYRKWVESGNDFDGVRWELQARHGDARAVASELLEPSVDARAAARVVFAQVSRLCDFRDVEGGRPERSPTSAWFAALRDGGDRAVGVPAAGAVGIDEKLAWLRQAVAPTLAAVYLARGESALACLVGQGLTRMGEPVVRSAFADTGGSEGETSQWDQLSRHRRSLREWMAATGPVSRKAAT